MKWGRERERERGALAIAGGEEEEASSFFSYALRRDGSTKKGGERRRRLARRDTVGKGRSADRRRKSPSRRGRKGNWKWYIKRRSSISLIFFFSKNAQTMGQVEDTTRESACQE